MVLGGIAAVFLLVWTGAMRPAEGGRGQAAPASTGYHTARGQARLATWATVKKEKDFGGGRRLVWIAIPSTEAPEDEIFDLNCLWAESPAGVALACPGADSSALTDMR